MSGRLLELLFLLPILLVSMMAHEVMHGLVAYRLGDPTAKAHGRLTANPLSHLDPLGTLMFVMTFMVGSFIFGWAKPVPVNPRYFRDNQKGMALVGIAGPATNLFIGVVLAALMETFQPQSELLLRTLFLAFQVNIVLGLFNLVPIPPLDGSRIVGGFLPPRLYYQWAALDRYGMLFFFLIIFVFQGPFFRVLGGAFTAIAGLLLPSYF